MKSHRRRKRRFRRHAGPAALPGTIAPQPGSATPVVRLIQYSPAEHREIEVGDVGSLVGNLDRSAVTWIDVCGLGDASVITTIGGLFELHRLALEDVVNLHQRPKVEMYGDSLFVIARSLPDDDLAANGDPCDSHQLAVFLGRDFVVTFREPQTTCLDGVRERLRAAHGRIRDLGADYLLYAILDVTVDSYFPVLEKHGERLDALDALIADKPQHDLIRQIHDLRSQLLMVRRSVWPLRDAISMLIRDSGDLISDDTDLYLRDCYDHTVQIIDVIETDRELCSDLRDFYLTTISNRMNQVIKYLTIIATLFIPLTFLTGLYGMNFNTQVSSMNMPELNWPWGYPFALSIMATTVIGSLVFFWKKGWLSS